METGERVGSYLAHLLPGASSTTRQGLQDTGKLVSFHRRDLLHPSGIQLPPFLVLNGHVMVRRLTETGQTYGVLIAGPGHLGGLPSVSDPDADALHELVALSDGSWAIWDPRRVRELALSDAGFAVDLLDHWRDLASVLSVRLDERSLETARERLAAILIRYGSVIFDTPHPVAQRGDLAAMVGASRMMMYRVLHEFEAEGLIKRETAGGIAVLDKPRLERLVAIAPPAGTPPL